MEPEIQFSCLQEPYTDPYPKPDKSSQYYNTLFLWDHSNKLILKNVMLRYELGKSGIGRIHLRPVRKLNTTHNWSSEFSVKSDINVLRKIVEGSP